MKKSDTFEQRLIYGVLSLAVIGLLFTFYTLLKPMETAQMHPKQMKSSGSMGFTAFDVKLATELMDKNNDGLCDFCGMRIEDCIAAGMMQCSGMDPDAKMGVLRSGHLHADFKLYLQGNALNFAQQEYFMKSMMMHLDAHPNSEDAGSVLHMHAKGVPLWLFFKSIGIELPNNIKVYVNGKLNSEGLNYAFKDFDKIAITDAADKALIIQQISSVTDYAKDHAKQGSTSV